MKKIKIIVVSTVVLASVVLASAFTNKTSSCSKKVVVPIQPKQPVQTVNMFVTHGHCSTPFTGIVDRITVDLGPLEEQAGNPIENMTMSFQIDPNSFNSCKSDDLTARVKTPGLFMGGDDKKIIFNSTNVFTMGVDWYQVNGMLSIKGVEKEVKFFVTGIRDADATMTSAMVLEGKVDLQNWGIDYDKIVNGKSDIHPTKWLHLNMRFGLC